MKGKTLVRIGAAFTALSMLGTMSAFADGAVDISKVAVGSNGDLTAEYTTDSTDQNTYMVFGGGNAADVFADRTTEWNGVEIFDIDQLVTKKTAFKLRSNIEKPATLYLGIGGTGVTADFVAINMTETVQSVNQPDAEDPAWAAQKVLKGLNDGKVDLPTAVTASVTPAGYDPNATAETKSYKITAWKSGDTELAIGEDGKVDISALDATDTAYTLTPVVAALADRTDLPTVDVTVTGKVTITDLVIGTVDDPKFAAYTVSASEAKTVEQVAAELVDARQAKTETNADFQLGQNRMVSYTWTLKDSSKESDFNAHTAGSYTFIGSNPTVVEDNTVTLPDGVSVVLSEDLAAEKKAPEVEVLITEKETVNITAVEMRDADGPVTVTDGIYTVADDFDNGTALQTVKDSLPNRFKVTETDKAEAEIPESLVFTAVDWLLYDENGANAVTYEPRPDVDTTYILKPKTRRQSADRVDGGEEYDYVFSLGSQTPDFFPVAKFTVKGKTEIASVVMSATELNAGAAEEAWLEDAVRTELNKLTWQAKDTEGNVIELEDGILSIGAWTFKPAEGQTGYDPTTEGSYVFEAAVSVKTDSAYKLADEATKVAVTVTVGAATPTNIPYGDVNNDGNVNPSDAILVYRYALKKVDVSSLLNTANSGKKYNGEYTEELLLQIMNVNGDKNINPSDAIQIYRKALKKIDKFDVEK